MNALIDNSENWNELLERIDSGEVIPVIGPGLYYIDSAEHPEGELLYDFLAKKLTEKEELTIPDGVNHKFARAAFLFLKKNESDNFMATKRLKQFLIDTLENVRLSKDNPLLKLSRITPFNIFINTTYDIFFPQILQATRRHKCKYLNYTLNDKKLHLLDDELFDAIDADNCTLVYNIYGNLRERINSAFTEGDILETIVSFMNDMENDSSGNCLFTRLKNHSVLFMGCGYDDWLFRFFIRTISNKPFSLTNFDSRVLKFVGDAIDKDNTTYHNLSDFLIKYNSKLIYSPNGKSFVDTLFKKFEKQFPKKILPVSEFPETAFISFNGENRETVFQLADRLKADGINVWVDKIIEPGDEIDNVIINAMIRCTVFIPIISKEAEKLLEGEKIKYHYQEWQWLKLYNKTDGNITKMIIPVIIDDTTWMHEDFKKLAYINLFAGKDEQYDKLKNRLLELRQQVERLTP